MVRAWRLAWPRWAGPLAILLGLGARTAAEPQSFRITAVSVQHEGRFQADPNGHQTPAQCARFHISGPAALTWFRGAREVSQHDWLETLDWTQCNADGTLVTADGHTYTWTLDQSGRGRVEITPTVSVFLAGPELPM